MNEYLILSILLLAHLLGDFYLQSEGMVKAKYFGSKKKWFKLGPLSTHIAHALIHGGLVLGLLVSFRILDLIEVSTAEVWLLSISLTFGHLFIDISKSWFSSQCSVFKNNAFPTLIVDQIAHTVFIFCIWIGFFDRFGNWVDSLNLQSLILVIAYLLVLKPTSIIVQLILLSTDHNGETQAEFTEKTKMVTADNDKQLPNAGKVIGYIERVVILTLIFADQYTAIGFIIAAKSVLRFGENNSKDTKLNEYVLLGTLASFAIVLLVGVMTKFIVENLTM
ncbi:DUF3307 domain-containing protein [Methylophaga nitratireducenticrescens]|uniref:DUF3307 domain-containing protein n=1 Tax=Methylophaga nitratireducenticrescens TaxID=754476 RepID=UPI000CDC4E3D|nr:DUF3307 domain-containing protein [Methylophaga nitratireducenticrescens]AUZ85224.1 hypothetical protein CDW43_11870 [Methylophaga nitratireducenticrescens]